MMSDYAELYECRFFEGLTLEQRSRVYSLCELIECPDGDVIFREGDPSDLLFVVLQGRVRISLPTIGEGEEALAIRGPRESFGDLNLLDGLHALRSASAISLGGCVLATLSRPSLRALMDRDPELGYRLAKNALAELGEQIRQTNQKLRFLAAASLFT